MILKAKKDKDAAAKPAKEAKAKKAAPAKAAKKDKGAPVAPALYDVIERPVITEKATYASQQGKVVFRIRPDVTKKQVKAAIEAIFGVEVIKVNTIRLPGKSKRFRGQQGTRSDVRKAIVTLKPGQVIDLASGAA